MCVIGMSESVCVIGMSCVCDGMSESVCVIVC